MKQEDKELLLRDLCARLPYGVKVEIISYGQETLKPWFGKLSCKDLDCFIHDVAYKSIKPYLRPMSSIASLISVKEWTSLSGIDLIDWYNANHIDYRGLIEKGLAIKVTEENNPYKE